MNRKKLKIALVGCGQIADAHLQEIRKIPCAEPIAVCDRHLDLARQAAVRFGVPAPFTHFGQMLALARPDVVHITTPPHTHASLAREALAAGAHVYLEKPFTVNLAEADEVLEAASANGRLVCAGHDQLFDPTWEELRETQRRGELGRIVHVESIAGYDLSGPFGRLISAEPEHWVRRLPGGLFHNNVSHPLYKIIDLLPDESPDVRAFWFDGQGAGFPTELRVLLQGTEATASILFTSAVRPLQRVTRVYGTLQCVEADFDGRLLRRTRPTTLPGPFARIQAPYRHLREAARSLRRNLFRFLRSDLHYFAGMNRLFRLFYQAILEGGSPPIADREIRRVTAVMDEIFRCCDREARATADVEEEASAGRILVRTN